MFRMRSEEHATLHPPLKNSPCQLTDLLHARLRSPPDSTLRFLFCFNLCTFIFQGFRITPIQLNHHKDVLSRKASSFTRGASLLRSMSQTYNINSGNLIHFGPPLPFFCIAERCPRIGPSDNNIPDKDLCSVAMSSSCIAWCSNDRVQLFYLIHFIPVRLY